MRFVFLTLLLVAGCAGRSSITDAGTTSAEMDEQLGQLRSQHYDVLAPSSFERASQLVAQAKEKNAKSGDSIETQNKIKEATMEMQRVEKLGSAADSSLHDVVVARTEAFSAIEKAETAGAENTKDLKAAYERANEHFLSLTKALEANEIESVNSHREETIARFRLVEDKAIQKANLDLAKAIVERAKSAGASNYAPESLKDAQKTIKEAEAFIRENPHSEEVGERGEEALISSEHALRITLESKKIAEQKPEHTALMMEHYIAGAEDELGLDDSDSYLASFSDRFETIQTQLVKLTNEEKALANRSDALQNEMDKAKGPAALDAKVKKLEALFSADEAEVVREGDHVIVHLRNLAFPVGKATVAKENFALLKKVEDSLNLFPKAKIVVEGHTDSTGNAKKNEMISQRRAEAVKEYLFRNEAVSIGDVTAVGKGAASPLANNDTTEGRAVNRRVDIVIEPNTSNLAE